ncbi:hypothetical protein DM02DRAFT_658779 [Periconia macrospinosa]|uniref:Uncharacterized protein n=1 Tax=Periconia macrospinosa TaxID=97972 RepID=A0A2V1DFT9_9PLEO|nr:hypothetical protein DM02DRAFT_658779 [Periconia macrospinosa]
MPPKRGKGGGTSKAPPSKEKNTESAQAGDAQVRKDGAPPAAQSAVQSTHQSAFQPVNCEPTPRISASVTSQTATPATVATTGASLGAGNIRQDAGKGLTASQNKSQEPPQQPPKKQGNYRAPSVETISAPPSPKYRNKPETQAQGKFVDSRKTRPSSPHQFAKEAESAKRQKITPNFKLVTPNGARISPSQVSGTRVNANASQQYAPAHAGSRTVQPQGSSSQNPIVMPSIHAILRQMDARAVSYDQQRRPQNASHNSAAPAVNPPAQPMATASPNAPRITSPGLLPPEYPMMVLDERQLRARANNFIAKDARDRELVYPDQGGSTIQSHSIPSALQDPSHLIDMIDRNQVLNQLMIRYLSTTDPEDLRNVIETLALANYADMVEWLLNEEWWVKQNGFHLSLHLGRVVLPNPALARYTAAAGINTNSTPQSTQVNGGPPRQQQQEKQQQHPVPQTFVEYHTKAQADAHAEIYLALQTQAHAQFRYPNLQTGSQHLCHPSTYPFLYEARKSYEAEHSQVSNHPGQGRGQAQQQVNPVFYQGQQQQPANSAIFQQRPQQTNPVFSQAQQNAQQTNLATFGLKQHQGRANFPAGCQAQHQQNIALNDPEYFEKARDQGLLDAKTAKAAEDSQRLLDAALRRRRREAELRADREAELARLANEKAKGKDKAKDKDDGLRFYLFGDRGFWNMDSSGPAGRGDGNEQGVDRDGDAQEGTKDNEEEDDWEDIV